MICNKCNHKLPDDSDFCQYCGNKIEKVSDTTVEDDEMDFDNVTPDEALNAILKMHAKETIRVMEVNSKTQPDNDKDVDFGLVPEKPIFTLALKSVDGEKEYLSKLYTANGEKIKYNRRGSTSVDEINGMIDIYDTYLPSGQPYKTIYINMYGAKKSTKAPAGFVLNNASQTRSIAKKEKPVKTRYCSHCGAMVDNETTTCTGCGKQYFRGFRLNKFTTTIIALVLIIVTVSTLGVLQYMNTQELKDKISDLNMQINSKQSSINQMKIEISDLESELLEHKSLVRFVDDHVVFIEDDGSELYHKFECFKFKGNRFWVYNTEVAILLDYSACSYCH